MKRMMLLVLAVLAPLALQAGIPVKGKVKSADGKPPALAHVHLTGISDYYRAAMQTVEADRAGKFTLDIEKPGMYKLWISAVDHQITGYPLIVSDGDKTIELEATLPGNEFVETVDEVKIIGDWNNFKMGSAEPMTRQPDGTFVYEVEVEGETVGYQLLGIDRNQHSVNGPKADSYKYDGGGDYISVLHVQPGKVKITFNPADLPRHDNADLPRARYDRRHAELGEIFAIVSGFERERAKLYAAYSAHRKQYGDEASKTFTYDAGALLKMLQAKMQPENSRRVKEIAALHLLQMKNLPGIKVDVPAKKFLELVPPGSDTWAFSPQIAGGVVWAKELSESEKMEIANAFIEHNPVREVRAQVLASLTSAMNYKGKKEEFARLYKMLSEGYGDVKSIQFTLKRLDPNRKVMAGKKVPAFEVKLLGSEETVSNTSMLGKYYIMDFWAVWCGPCRAEMPTLHAAYQKFKSPKFEILSLSFDNKPEDIAKYRAEKWKMPWLHTFVEGGFNSPLAQAFEVMGIPKPILVGPDGTILATEGALRGKRLEKTLAKYMSDRTGTNE